LGSKLSLKLGLDQNQRRHLCALFKGNKSLIMNDNGHSQNSVKVPRCIWRLDRTSAAKVEVVSVSNRG